MMLATLEKKFQNYIRTHQATIIAAISDNNKLSAKERLAIYFDAYRLRLLEVLESDYPKLQALMGKEDFEVLGCHYIEGHPPEHFSLRYFGKDLASFLLNTTFYSKHPYLHEMAMFEWTMGDALDAPDAVVLAKDALQSLPLDCFSELKVHFHPSVVLLHFEWNTPHLWQAIEEGDKKRLPKKLENPITYLIFRSDLVSIFKSLTKNETLALKALQNLLNMAEVCEMLNDHMEEEKVPEFILQCLSVWLESGIVAEIKISA